MMPGPHSTDLQGLPVVARSYPGEMPADLTPWYVYLADAGHSILCVRYEDASDEHGRLLYQAVPPVLDSDIEGLLIPVPVRTVLRIGYRMAPGGSYGLVPVVGSEERRLDYRRDLGLVVPPEDEEF